MLTIRVQQGDSLESFIFVLVLHPLIHQINNICKFFLHTWYLDDGTIIGDSEEVAKSLNIIRESGPRLGPELNIQKTEIF